MPSKYCVLLAICSDDDLLPYAMTDDPDASVPTPPRYLRTLLQGMYVGREYETVAATGNFHEYELYTFESWAPP